MGTVPENPNERQPEPHIRPYRRIRRDIESDGVAERTRETHPVYSEEHRRQVRQDSYGPDIPTYRLISEVAVYMKNRQVKWAWPGRIPLGAVTILEGDPDVGKSAIACSLAAHFTRGRKLPDWRDDAIWGLDGPVPVGYVSGEDVPEATLLPRFLVAGGDNHLLHFYKYVEFAIGPTAEPLSLPTHMEALRDWIKTMGVRVVIIDVLASFTDDRIDTHTDASVRRMLTPLGQIAEELHCVFIVIRHLVKGGAGKAIYAGQGSIAYGGSARSVLVATTNPNDADSFVLAVTKCNLAPRDWRPTLGFHHQSVPFSYDDGTTGTQVKIEWDGVVDLTADEATCGDKKSKTDVACDFLCDFLGAGPTLASAAEDAAAKAGISKMTLKRAKKEAGVEAYKEKGAEHGPWFWKLD